MSACPCGSGADYQACCAPLHKREREAETAEQLMRSRYSAYVLGLEEYLRYSWHPSKRPAGGLLQQGLQWTGLDIRQYRLGGAGDKQGYVEFVAHYRQGGQEGQLHETSRFQRYQGRWVYVDGQLDGQAISRNAPCPCGSGKKYKHCCNN